MSVSLASFFIGTNGSLRVCQNITTGDKIKCSEQNSKEVFRGSLESGRTARQWFVISVLGRLEQQDYLKFEASLGYRVRPFLIKTKARMGQNKVKPSQSKEPKAHSCRDKTSFLRSMFGAGRKEETRTTQWVL